MHEFINDNLSNEDEVLLAELKEALADTGTPPPDAAAAARGAFTWRTIDADLARLTFDSASIPAAQPALRASGTTRYLTFQVGGVRIDLEISPDRVIGQIDPPSYDLLTAETSGGTRVTARVDDLGCFMLTQGPRGQVRFTLQGACAASVHSEWTPL
jgi:hypothetical protein